MLKTRGSVSRHTGCRFLRTGISTCRISTSECFLLFHLITCFEYFQMEYFCSSFSRWKRPKTFMFPKAAQSLEAVEEEYDEDSNSLQDGVVDPARIGAENGDLSEGYRVGGGNNSGLNIQLMPRGNSVLQCDGKKVIDLIDTFGNM